MRDPSTSERERVTHRQGIHYTTSCLFRCCVFKSRWTRLIFVHSFDVAPITLSDKVLVHLVLPRCEVVSIQLLARENAPHLSIHDCVDVYFPSFFSLGHALCSITTIAKSQDQMNNRKYTRRCILQRI